MDIISTLDTLLAGATSNQVLLNSLIAQLGAETIQSDNSEIYTPPTYDEETGVWVCAQATANTDNGEYLGVYTLPDTSLCSVITAVTVISASAPAAPNAPARVLPCGADPATGWVDVASIGALAGQQFIAFSIRSATPFEVEVSAESESLICNLDNWTQVYLGTVVERGLDYIILESGVYSGLYGNNRVAIGTGDPNTCCCVVGWDIIQGTADNRTNKYIPCGRTITNAESDYEHGIPASSAQVFTVGIDAYSSFRVKFTFAGG